MRCSPRADLDQPVLDGELLVVHVGVDKRHERVRLGCKGRLCDDLAAQLNGLLVLLRAVTTAVAAAAMPAVRTPCWPGPWCQPDVPAGPTAARLRVWRRSVQHTRLGAAVALRSRLRLISGTRGGRDAPGRSPAQRDHGVEVHLGTAPHGPVLRCRGAHLPSSEMVSFRGSRYGSSGSSGSDSASNRDASDESELECASSLPSSRGRCGPRARETCHHSATSVLGGVMPAAVQAAVLVAEEVGDHGVQRLALHASSRSRSPRAAPMPLAWYKYLPARPRLRWAARGWPAGCHSEWKQLTFKPAFRRGVELDAAACWSSE